MCVLLRALVGGVVTPAAAERTRFQRPCQGRHLPVCTVAQQVVRGSTQRANTALQLRDQVLLITSLVAMEHDLFGRDGLAIVADVEPVANLIEQHSLTLFLRDVLPDDNHPTTAMAGRRPVFELSDIFVFQFQMFIAALTNDLPFDIHGFRSFGCRDGPLGSLQRFPCGFRQIFGQSLEICSVLVAEIELHTLLIPTIQMLGLTETCSRLALA